MVRDHFWKNAFLTPFWPIFGPKKTHFQGILGFSMAQKAPPRAQNGLKTLLGASQVVFFFRCLADVCDGSPPATRRRGGYSETLARGQPGPTRAAPPAAFGVAARGGGTCGGCGSGGRPQRGANQPDGADDRGQVRACDMRATCLRSVLRSVRGGKGQGREGEAGRA